MEGAMELQHVEKGAVVPSPLIHRCCYSGRSTFPLQRMEDEVTKELTDSQKAEYFRRSYTFVDVLWFMEVGELRGFEDALEIDRMVWSILPTIQA